MLSTDGDTPGGMYLGFQPRVALIDVLDEHSSQRGVLREHRFVSFADGDIPKGIYLSGSRLPVLSSDGNTPGGMYLGIKPQDFLCSLH